MFPKFDKRNVYYVRNKLTIIYFINQYLQIKLKDSEKLVKVLEDKIKTMRKECLESMLKYSSLYNENIHLKTKIVTILFDILNIKHNQKTTYIVKCSFRMNQMN